MDRYRQAEAYFQCHGHLCPYQRRNAPLPAGLSQWLTAQRKAKQAGKLSPEKSRMLESVGMIWDVYQSLWETAYQQAEAYVQRHGHLRVSKDSGPDQFLGRWTHKISTFHLLVAGDTIVNFEDINIQAFERVGGKQKE